eukprot:Amastigsp_a842780_4.p3 type:complete len:106 gc:universal Amastigsp_a842780_4:35-352(+)
MRNGLMARVIASRGVPFLEKLTTRAVWSSSTPITSPFPKPSETKTEVPFACTNPSLCHMNPAPGTNGDGVTPGIGPSKSFRTTSKPTEIEPSAGVGGHSVIVTSK